MIALFQAVSDRLRALFVADLALDLEAQLASRQADRQAALLLEAERHERQGFDSVAASLRARAEALSIDRPLAGVLPMLDHWQVASAAPGSPSPPSPVPVAAPSPSRRKGTPA